MGTMPPALHKSSAHLPKAEDEEGKQQQPTQDAANEDPQGDEDGAGLNHLQEALLGEGELFVTCTLSPSSPHPTL